ncbi:MAG: hypothetical protein ACLQVM_22920, partial [Terriglobia bacterium]
RRSIGYRLLITGHGLLHAGLTLVNAPMEHPKEADDRIKGIITSREDVLNSLPESVLKRGALGISLAE